MDLNDWLIDTESSFLNDPEHSSNDNDPTTTAPTLDINALLGELATTDNWQVPNMPLSSLPSSSASTSGQSNTTGSSPSRDRGVSPSTTSKEDDDDDHGNSKQKELAKMTGRLDFRSSIVSGAATEVPEAQWRNMSSKDRRKLRNKISARNSRQKAKGVLHDSYLFNMRCLIS